MVWSGISVRIPDQTAHLDRTYDIIAITTEYIYATCTNPKGTILSVDLEPKGYRGQHNPEGLGRGGRGGHSRDGP